MALFGKSFGEKEEPIKAEEIIEDIVETTEATEIAMNQQETAVALEDANWEETPDSGATILGGDNETHILSRDKDSLTWNANQLVYTKKSKEITFELNGTVIVEYSPEKRGLLDSREIAIWAFKRGPFDKKEYTLTTATYKKAVSLDFSKKEADNYAGFYQQIVNDLGNSIVPFRATMDLGTFLLDEEHGLIKDENNQFFRIADIESISVVEDGVAIMGPGTQGVPGALRINGIGEISMFPARGRAEDVVVDMVLNVTLKGEDVQARSYSILDKKSARNGKEYRAALGTAFQLFTTLNNMIG